MTVYPYYAIITIQQEIDHIKKNTTGNRTCEGIDNLKQDKNINIRVNGEMRAAFIKAAHDNGENGTSLIRDFMQRYIKENSKQV